MPSQHMPVVENGAVCDDNDAEDSLQLTASRLAESTLKRALAQLICEAIDKEEKEEAAAPATSCAGPENGDEELQSTARGLVSEVMREAWKSFLDDCDLQEWLQEDPEGNLTRQMASNLLKKAKEPNSAAKNRSGTSQPDVEKFFQSPGQRSNAPSSSARPTPGTQNASSGEELSFRFDGGDCRVDLRAVRPYLPALSKATSHDAEGNEFAILLLDSAALPTRSIPDYEYIMQQMFLTTMYWVEEYMTSNYSVVYLHGNSSKDHWPRAKWLKQWCQALTTKTTKHLSHLYVVFPTIWIRTLRIISRPFVKIKASVHFVSSVRSLLHQLPEAESGIPKNLLEANS